MTTRFQLPAAAPRIGRRHFALLAAIAGLGVQGTASAQASYPERPVKIVVAFAAGGPNDVMARMLAERLSEQMGQPFIIDNKPGAGGTIGTEMVARSAADGYTLLFPSAPFVTAPALYGDKLKYDTLKDITGIAKVAESPLVMMVPAQSSFKTLKDLVSAGHTKPGTLNYGSGGIASTPHLATSLLELSTQSKFQHVPYRGGGPALQALSAGQIDLFFDSITTAGPQVAGGRIRALGITGDKRSAILPDVPTFAEAGFPNYKMVHWVGLAAPGKTPPAILDKLHKETIKALGSPEMRVRLAQLGAEPVMASRDAFNSFLKQEVANWTKVIEQAGIKPE